jgi:hypothetical protein
LLLQNWLLESLFALLAQTIIKLKTLTQVLLKILAPDKIKGFYSGIIAALMHSHFSLPIPHNDSMFDNGIIPSSKGWQTGIETPIYCF